MTNRKPAVRNPLPRPVEVYPLQFRDRTSLAECLSGARILYNTYWIRYPYRRLSYGQAMANTEALVGAARAAGVERIVHFSICNPSLDSKLAYYRGKAEVELSIVRSGLRYAFVRPTVIFGRSGVFGDILVNNIAWFLRRFPVFAVPGSGDYRIQPVSIDDVADLAVEAGVADDDLVIDAAGPETYSFQELVERIGAAVGCRRPILRLSPGGVHLLGWLAGSVLGDIVLTREEILGLMGGLLVSRASPRGKIAFSEWLEEAGPVLGRRYASELARHYGRDGAR